MNVADQYAGQSGPCSRCGKPITIPGTPVPGTPFSPPPKKSSTRLVIAALAVGLLAVLICAGVLAALLLPAVQAAREAARRAQCSANLRQIGVALHNYHSAHGCFPPAVFADEHGKPTESWRVAILPYVGASNLYATYDPKQPWDSPQNRALGKTPLAIYRCPSDAAADATETSYVRIVGKNTAGGVPNETVRLSDITAGPGTTIMVVEISGLRINWAVPRDLTADEFMALVAKGRTCRHLHGYYVLMVDGSVHYFSDTIDSGILRAMVLRNPGQPVKGPAY